MRASLRTCAILFAAVVLAAPAHGQAEPGPQRSARSGLGKPLAAAGLEYLVPTLGHAYAGDWERGVPPALVFAAGAGLALAGMDSCAEEEGCGVVLVGAAFAVAGKLWGVWSAVETARDGNARVRPTLALRPRALEVGLTVAR